MSVGRNSIDMAVSGMKELLLEGLVRRVLTEDGKAFNAGELPGKVFQPFMDRVLDMATERQSLMRDRDELWVLDSALQALEGGEVDIARATQLLKDRKSHLQRRAASTEEPTEPPKDGEAAGEAEQAPEENATAFNNDKTAGYWNQACEGLLSVGVPRTDGLALRGAEFSDVWAGATRAELQSQLAETGWMQSAVPIVENAEMLHEGLKRIESLGFAPAFLYVFDQAWDLLTMAWDHAEAMLGTECVLDTNQVTAFHLQHREGNKGDKYVGANFGTPHRDQSYADTHTAEGEVKIVHVWIPLNDVSVENGCMYVLPREFDNLYADDKLHAHRQCHLQQESSLAQMIWFPLEGVRPLTGPAGTLMAWSGCAVHWGSACQRPAANNPRASMAFVFRRADTAHDATNPPLTRAAVQKLEPAERLQLIVLQRQATRGSFT